MWYNSYFIATIEVQKVHNLKGVPEKFRAWEGLSHFRNWKGPLKGRKSKEY